MEKKTPNLKRQYFIRHKHKPRRRRETQTRARRIVNNLLRDRDREKERDRAKRYETEATTSQTSQRLTRARRSFDRKYTTRNSNHSR